MALDSCLACGKGLKPVVDLGDSPVLTGALFNDSSSARQAVSGRLNLGICRDCGHVQNVAFDPERVQYDVTYDNSLHFSPTFQRYADELAAGLVIRYGIRGKRIVEVGSGKGDFLQSICALGGNTGIGYDPTVEPDTEIPNVQLVQDYFRPGHDVEPYDLLVCRHVLEHLDDPAGLLRALSAAARPDALHYFEVPAAEFNFGPDGLWDCIYPHVSYFSQTSLATLIGRCGFEIISIRRAFHGQFLAVEARVGNTLASTETSPEAHLALFSHFVERYRASVARWRAHAVRAQDRGETLVVWGAGSKGVNFLNAVDPDGHLAAVDVNPRKWGKYLPLGGHEVIAPSQLIKLDVSEVVVTNPVYEDEITRSLIDLGVKTHITGLGVPPGEQAIATDEPAADQHRSSQ
jgi:SAM-dependent methyltransferase